jgi:hypothetical protein
LIADDDSVWDTDSALSLLPACQQRTAFDAPVST